MLRPFKVLNATDGSGCGDSGGGKADFLAVHIRRDSAMPGVEGGENTGVVQTASAPHKPVPLRVNVGNGRATAAVDGGAAVAPPPWRALREAYRQAFDQQVRCACAVSS